MFFPSDTAGGAVHPDPPHSALTLQQPNVAQEAFNPGLFDANFHTEDANLLEFFRYGLAQWPEDATNIWPPINDFESGGG